MCVRKDFHENFLCISDHSTTPAYADACSCWFYLSDNAVSCDWGHRLHQDCGAMRKRQSLITEAARHASEPFDRFLRILLHSSWWVSIDQLFFFCRRAPQLWNAISPLGSVTFGTGDIMTEIAHCDRLGILKAQWTR